MSRWFIIAKRKSSKSLLGAIPARKGISKDALRKAARQQIRKGFSFRIVSEVELRKKFSGLIKKPKSRVVKRSKRVRRRKK